tara:strand:+ start:35515 stop:35757 length:243 start_codon:yes stop_codon:yes gene_type:complete
MLHAVFAKGVFLRLASVPHGAWVSWIDIRWEGGKVAYLDHFALQPQSLKLDTFVLHIYVQVPVARTDAAVAFDDPGVEIV